MRICFAGAAGGGVVGDCQRERELNDLWSNRLWSYFHLVAGRDKMPRTKPSAVELFIDSGAFSAWTQDIDIDIQEYITFIKKHQDKISVYANLDAIGDPHKTLENQTTMEKAGLKPLPCFHYGEDPEFLEHYMKTHDYIALGGMVPISTKDLAVWLDGLFRNYLVDESGMPHVKVHGFGLTSLKLMLRYPWYSVDSTSWVITGRMGSIYVPRFRKGQYVYDEDSWKVAVSNKSPSKKEAGRHLTTMSSMDRKRVLHYIESKGFVLGVSDFTMEDESYELQKNQKWAGEVVDGSREVEHVVTPGLSNDYRFRDKINVIYFLDLEGTLPDWPWPLKREAVRGFGI